MTELTKIDLGSIKIHKKVLAEIAASAIKDIEGVRLAPPDVIATLAELFGLVRIPGVVITIDKGSQVSIEILIFVKYGMNIPDVARRAQDAVRSAIERTVDIDLKDVNINIQGVDREA
jgi:uncharacterized alkaline shock family protein YloU